MKKLLNALALMLAIVNRPDRLWREAKISGLLHAQFAGPAGSARRRKRPNLNRSTGIPIAELSAARADRVPKHARGNRLLRISPLGGRSAHACDQRSHRSSARQRSVLHGLYV